MTVDELIDLTQALLDEVGFYLGALRDDGAPDALAGLTDEQFLLAVRFLAGERPDIHQQVREFVSSPPPRRLVSLSEDEAAERLAKLEELDEETPAGKFDIGDGVTIGL